MAHWIVRLYRHRLISRILHTPLHLLERELRGCGSVLDLGCGPDSPLQYCTVRHSVGVEVFAPFLEESRKKHIHSEYMCADVTAVDFGPRSFDAVVLMEVLEHIGKDEGRLLLEKAERWAVKKVIVATPNGFLAQGNLSDNPYEAHRSGWSVDELAARGYRAYGISGWKLLRKENTSEGYGVGGGAIFATTRFRPRIFWIFVSGLTQLVTYYFPSLSFEVFYVKDMR